MKNLAKALSLFQGALKPIPKDSTNPFFKSGYSSLTACWEEIRPLLSKHGLCVIQLTDRAGDATLILRTVLLHESGELLEGFYPIYSKDNSPQAIGSAMTYAKRYALQAILGLSSEDDDGNTAQHQHPTASSAHKPIAASHSPMTGGPTEKQIARLMAIANQNGWSEVDIKGYLAQIGLTSRSQLNRLQYDTLCENITKFPRVTKGDFAE